MSATSPRPARPFASTCHERQLRRGRCYGHPVSQSTTSTIVIAAPAATVMDVIADVQAYPEWTPFTATEVLERDAQGRPSRAHFSLRSGGISDEQVMAYTWQPEAVTWTQVEGRLLRSLVGVYQVRPALDATCEVTYDLTAEPVLPMIGALRRRAEKVIVDTALKGLKERAESLA